MRILSRLKSDLFDLASVPAIVPMARQTTPQEPTRADSSERGSNRTEELTRKSESDMRARGIVQPAAALTAQARDADRDQAFRQLTNVPISFVHEKSRVVVRDRRDLPGEEMFEHTEVLGSKRGEDGDEEGADHAGDRHQ